MIRAELPFLVQPSLKARKILGSDARRVAVMALRAILRHRKSLEVAHQQIVFRDTHLAFSSRVNAGGFLVLDLDIGDPRLADRLVLEEDLRRNDQGPRGIARSSRSRR